MITVAGVRFKDSGKTYYFNKNNLKLNDGDFVIVETANGDEYGQVVINNKKIDEKNFEEPLKNIIRIATPKDERLRLSYKSKEPEALKICQEKIQKHNLQMKLVDVEYKFDGSKIVFSFTADGRIDFRELVKDLAAVFKTRIELRQIGVRDEVKKCGGNGICGRELCCVAFLGNFETVSIKMAKEQNISLNPSKISGNCGRLMCCLKYEEEVYTEKLKRLPRVGAVVKTKDGTGEVCGVEVLKEDLNIKFIDGDNMRFKKYNVKDVVVIKDADYDDSKIVAENSEDLAKLKELEKLEKDEKKNAGKNSY